MANRSGKGGFKKGKSGNKNGRPKGSKNAKTLINELYAKNPKYTNPLTFMVELFNNSKAAMNLRLTAAKEIADRMYGKAESNANLDVGGLNISIKRKDDKQEKF